jgi:hypothetical protein
MKHLRTLTLILSFLGFALVVNAQPLIDSLTVQGYLKRSNGTAVTNGTYNIAYGVRQNGVTIWGRQVSTTVTNGLFSVKLSGLGSDLSGLGAGTGMNADYSAITLNPALLQAAGNGGIVVRVYAVSPIDGANPQFDVTIASSPTAFVAGIAQAVATDAVTLTGISTAARTNVSSGMGDAAKLVQLDASGLISATMMPTSGISGSAVTVGTVPTARLDGVSTSVGAGDSGKVVLLNGSGRIDNTMFPPILPAADGSALTNVTAAAVAAGAVNLAGLNTAIYTNSSAGAGDANKLAQLGAGGTLNANMMPTTGMNASALTTGTLPTARLDAVNTSAGASDAGKVPLLGAAGTLAANMMPSTGLSATSITSGTLGGLTRLSLSTIQNNPITSSTTYNSASPLTFSSSVITFTPTGANTVTLNCISDTNAVSGSILVAIWNPTMAGTGQMTVNHAQPCTAPARAIRTGTNAAVSTTTSSSTGHFVFIYDATNTVWHLVASSP